MKLHLPHLLYTSVLAADGAEKTAVIHTGDNAGLTVKLVNADGIDKSVYQGFIEGDAALTKQGVDYDMTIGGTVQTSCLSVDEGILRIGGALTTAKASIAADALLELNVYMDVTSPAGIGAVVSSTGTVSLGNAEINLYNASTSFNSDERALDLVLVEGAEGTTASLGNDYRLSAGFLSALYNLRLETRGGDIVLVGTERTDNPYLAGATTFNSTAGAHLLDASKWVIAGDQHSNLYRLSDSVARDLEKGRTAAASRKLAAAAGSTVNALGTAQRDALRAQMTWIRNRTAQMGVDTALVNQDMPYSTCGWKRRASTRSSTPTGTKAAMN